MADKNISEEKNFNFDNPSFDDHELDEIKVESAPKCQHEQTPNIPDFNEVISEHLANLKILSNQIFFEINIERTLEPLNLQNVLILCDKTSSRAFVLLLFTINNNKFAFYWRNQHKRQIFTVECEGVEELRNFIRDHLINAVENDLCGVIPDFSYDPQQLVVSLEIFLLTDNRRYNLLFLACETDKERIAECLLHQGFSVSFVIDGKIAADVAYESNNFNTLFVLLKFNSRFPKQFDAKLSYPENISNFLKLSSNFRNFILNEQIKEIYTLINENRNLKHFYDSKNQSITTFAVINKKFKIYKILLQKNIFFGARENIDEIMDRLGFEEQRNLRDLHREQSRNMTDKHLMILISNSSVVSNESDDSECLGHIYRAFEYLNEIPSAKPILKAIAAKKDFEIHFDFNQETVRFLDPAAYANITGMFFACGRVLIGAKLLLDSNLKYEVYGVLIHELCHFAMWLVFENGAKPYRSNDVLTFNRFECVVKDCKNNSAKESLIQSVFDDYPDEMIHIELIVRSPQMLVQYQESPDDLQENMKNFATLHEFFDQIIPDIESSVQKIENEANSAYKIALQQITYLVWIIWFLMTLVVIVGPITFWLFFDPTYTWNSLKLDERLKILNSTVNYRGVDVRLNELLANDSEAFQHIPSDVIKMSLNGDLKTLSEELNNRLNNYVFLSSSNLTLNFWDKILQSNVTFQGETVQMSRITFNISSLRKLSEHQISNILLNKGLQLMSSLQVDTFYLPRKFTQKAVNESKIFNLNEVYDVLKSKRIFTLLDPAGSGKSSTFRFMAYDFKRSHPDHWIEFIELKNNIEIFKLFEEEKPSNITQVLNLIANNILNLKGLEKDLFNDLFSTNKVVFFWDALDEIYPAYDEDFLTIPLIIFNQTENLQLISSRLQHEYKLYEKFGYKSYSLLPYSGHDRDNFVVKSLISKNFTDERNLEILKNIQEFFNNILKSNSKSFWEDINNPLILKLVLEIAIDKKLSRNLNNIYEIYNLFTTLKLKIVNEKGAQVQAIAQSVAQSGVQDAHMAYALKFIVGSKFFDYFGKQQMNLDDLVIMSRITKSADVASYGIVSLKSSGKFDFSHRTFAEFFVAQYLIKNIYEDYFNPRNEEMNLRIILLHTMTYDYRRFKNVQEFILSFLNFDTGNKKTFSRAVHEFFKDSFKNFDSVLQFNERNPIFIKFFEKDSNILKTISGVRKYNNTEQWLEHELDIKLGGKKSFNENNQLAIILMRMWQFERKGNKKMSEFIKNATNILSTQSDRKISFGVNTTNLTDAERISENHSNISIVILKNLNQTLVQNLTLIISELSSKTYLSEFLKLTSDFLTTDELKVLFINSVKVLSYELLNSDSSNFFITKLSQVLNISEIKETFMKIDLKNDTLFYKTLSFENEPLNKIVLSMIDKNFSDDDIFKLLTKPARDNSTIPMIAAKTQDRNVFRELLNLIKTRTSKVQLRSILLQRDNDNDTMLQYSHFFKYPDNFVAASNIYLSHLSIDEIQKTFLDRKQFKFASFGEYIRQTRVDVFKNVAHFIDGIFYDNDEGLIKLLSRRNENGDTIFSLYKNTYKAKLSPFVKLLKAVLPGDERKLLLVRENVTVN